DPWSSQPAGQPSSAPAGGGAPNDPWAAPGVGNDEPPF
ncbi:single-stranded DNA-binding protein, partial [Nocardioides sp.]